MRRLLPLLSLLLLCTCVRAQVSVHLPKELSDKALDGRLLVMLSPLTEGEPRFQVTDDPNTAQVFGMDIETWRPDETIDLVRQD
jgi:hypothetical protein